MSTKQKYIVWKRLFGYVPVNGYMTDNKPYTKWGYEIDAKHFTQKQASKIVHGFNDYAQHSEIWGYSPIQSQDQKG